MRERVSGFFKDFRGFGKDAHRLVKVSVLGSVADVPMWFLLSLYLNFLGFSRVELGTVILSYEHLLGSAASSCRIYQR